MTENRTYTTAVENGVTPNTPRVPLDDSFKNEKGEILNVLFTEIRSVARIGSHARQVRANHFHKTDSHYALVEYGKVLYFHRPVGSTEIPEPEIYGPGEMFYSPPNVEHAMLFAVDTVIYTFAKNIRTHEEHEADLVRVDFITPEIVEKFLSKV